MARYRRAPRFSRTLTGFVVVAVFVAGAVQYRRVRARDAAAEVSRAATAKPVIARATAATQPVVANASAAPAATASHSSGFTALTGPIVSTTPALGSSAGHAMPTGMVAAIVPTGTPMHPATTTLEAKSPAAPMLLATTPAAVADASNTGMSGNAITASYSASPLTESQSLFANGDLVAARRTLNDALVSGSLSAADVAVAKQRISQINQTLIFSTDKFADDPFGGVVIVKPGDQLTRIAKQQKLNWTFLCELNHMSDPRKLRSGQRLKVLQGPFAVIVYKHNFTMDVYLGGTPGTSGSMYVRSYAIGLGKDDSTPTGTWAILNRVKDPTYYSPRGEGVIEAGDPKNPLGPCWLGLVGTDGQAVGKESYGIHGTIEPDSIGHMASMGCIRMHNEDALAVYQLLTENKSTVIVRD